MSGNEAHRIEARLDALEAGQKRLEIKMYDEIAKLTSAVNAMGERTIAHLEAMTSEWRSLAQNLHDLKREHLANHRPKSSLVKVRR